MRTVACLAKKILSGVVLMGKLALTVLHGVDIHVGILTLHFSNPIRPFASSAGRPCTANDHQLNVT